MKTNKMMRIASVLLVAVLLTTCVISGTFAKYTTTINGTATTARVAKWGFGTTSTIAYDLFNTDYTDVVSSNTDNVIAPGTKGTSAVTLTYAGTTNPEVDYVVTLAVDETNTSIADGIKNNTSIKWYFNGAKAGTNGTWDELITAINGYSEDVSAGALPTLTNANIGWEWEFTGNDAGDTALGDVGTDLVKLTIKLTAAQVNTAE